MPTAIKGRNSPDNIEANKVFKASTEEGLKKDHHKIPAGVDSLNITIMEH